MHFMSAPFSELLEASVRKPGVRFSDALHPVLVN